MTLTLNQMIEGIEILKLMKDVEVNIKGRGDGTVYFQVTEKNYTIQNDILSHPKGWSILN